MTVQSDIYRQKIHDLAPDLQVESWPVPSLPLGRVWRPVNQCYQESGL